MSEKLLQTMVLEVDRRGTVAVVSWKTEFVSTPSGGMKYEMWSIVRVVR
jgi:hypothetical protein